MLASRIAALTIAAGALVASTGPAFAAYGGGDGSNSGSSANSNTGSSSNQYMGSKPGSAANQGANSGAGSAANQGANSGAGSAANQGANAGAGSAANQGANAGAGSAANQGANSGAAGSTTNSATAPNSDSAATTGTNPHPVAPGANVWITDGFTESFCPSSDMTAVAKSDGFKTGSVNLTRGGTFKGLAGKGFAVDKPGSYEVSVTCASGKTSAADFQTLVVSPKGAAATGDGASLLGSGTNEATGLALLGGALALGTVVVRRKAKAER